MIISTRHDLDFFLSDPDTHPAALAYLQALLDEQYGYNATGVWTLVGGGGLERLGLTRAKAVAIGAVDRAVAEPAGPDISLIKDESCVRLQAEKWRRLYGTFTDSHGNTYAVDADSRALINGRVTTINAGKPVPADFAWKTARKDEAGKPVYVPHAAASFVALAFEIDDWTDAVFKVSEAAQNTILADDVTTAEQVAAIEAEVVWP